jgi:hypothetical protein
MKEFFRRLCLPAIVLFFLAYLQPSPTPAQQAGSIYCSQNAQYNASTNGLTRIFTSNAASSNKVYICGYVANVGASATNVQLEYGTGTNCGTGTTALTPLFVLPAAGQIKEDSPVWRGLLVPSGNDVCVNSSAGNPVQWIVYYSYQQ